MSKIYLGIERKCVILKMLHISDLHLGKRLNGFSLIEDQRYILNEILGIVNKENPDCILIAGDIYDKSIPPSDAVSLFDEFLTGLSEKEKEVFIISGNHDSPERTAFGSKIMEKSGIHISPVYGGEINSVTFCDDYGELKIFMLPFIKPANARAVLDINADSYTSAVFEAIKDIPLTSGRNVLITHQFVSGGQRSESEEISVGGTDNVNPEIFEKFDYVALGHLHRAQNIGKNLRYSGAPLKYSFSEANDKKTVTYLELKEKGNLNIKEIPLKPLRDMREIKGKYEELTDKRFYEGTGVEDYLRITLTDEDFIYEAMAKLRCIYPNLMRLDYDNKRTRANNFSYSALSERSGKSPTELFEELYEKQNNVPMNDEQRETVRMLIEETENDLRG